MNYSNMDQTMYNILQELEDLKNESTRIERRASQIKRELHHNGHNLTKEERKRKFEHYNYIKDKVLNLSRKREKLADKGMELADKGKKLLEFYIAKTEEGFAELKKMKNATEPDDNPVVADTTMASPQETRKQTKKRNTEKDNPSPPKLSETTDKPDEVTPLMTSPETASEQIFCFCKHASYGEMIACDNPKCVIEWFHFECVGIKSSPKGKWYCPDCAQK